MGPRTNEKIKQALPGPIREGFVLVVDIGVVVARCRKVQKTGGPRRRCISIQN